MLSVTKVDKVLISFQISSLLIYIQLATLPSLHVVLFVIFSSWLVPCIFFTCDTIKTPLRLSMSENVFYSLTLFRSGPGCKIVGWKSFSLRTYFTACQCPMLLMKIQYQYNSCVSETNYDSFNFESFGYLFFIPRVVKCCRAVSRFGWIF